MTTQTTDEMELAAEILTLATEMTFASIRPDGTPHASTVSFASSNLTVYFAVAIDSQKAFNIQHCNRVAYTANTRYRSWHEIRGLAVDAIAQLVTGVDELSVVSAMLRQKYPEFCSIVDNPAQLPWPGMLFIRCDPTDIVMLDYTQGFGHTVYFQTELASDVATSHSPSGRGEIRIAERGPGGRKRTW